MHTGRSIAVFLSLPSHLKGKYGKDCRWLAMVVVGGAIVGVGISNHSLLFRLLMMVVYEGLAKF